VGWRPKKDLGQIYFLIFFYRVFSSYQEKNRDKKTEKKIGFGCLVGFFVEAFRHDFV
jgi:hypothetical protein